MRSLANAFGARTGVAVSGAIELGVVGSWFFSGLEFWFSACSAVMIKRELLSAGTSGSGLWPSLPFHSASTQGICQQVY
jgi:hypothetical protein